MLRIYLDTLPLKLCAFIELVPEESNIATIILFHCILPQDVLSKK